MWLLVSATVLAAGSGAGRAQAAGDGQAATAPVGGANAGTGQATVTFLFDRPGLPVPHFLLTVREDGSGRYEADEAPAAATGGGTERQVDRPVTISAPTVAKMFAVARAQKYFGVRCESKIKNLANTGKKVLTYTGPDGSGSCTYNYSEIKDIQALTETFLATAFTMDEGRKLEFKKRYDRLGLDAEMASLAHAAEQKQAVEMGTISTVLTQIAGDTELMERVRLRAAKLLELAQPAP